MERREPPSLSFPGPARPRPDVEAMPRLRPLRSGERQRRGWLARLGALALYLAVALAFIVVAAGTFLFIAAPTDLVRDQIVAQVKQRTGRTLALNGPTSLSLFPSFGIRLNDVSLSAPPGMATAPLVHMKRLAVDVRLLPLLQREIVIERLVLGEPVFELMIDAQGRKSWEFADDEARPDRGPVRYAQATPRGSRSDALPPELKDFVRNSSNPEQVQGKGGGASLEDLVLADVRIENGTLRYADLRSGARQEVRAIHAELGLKTLASPLEIKGSLAWQGETLQVNARLQTAKALIDGRPARLVATISGQALEATYDGTVIQRGAAELEGKLAVKAGSVRQLASWFGTDLAPSAGFGPANLAGILKVAGTTASLDALVLNLDGATTTGTAAVEAAGAVPQVKANLRVAELVLDKYRATGPAPQRRPQPVSTPPSAAPQARPAAAASGGPTSIEDLIERSAADGPQVRGFTQREGWSSEPIDLAGLAAVDVDARIAIARLASDALRIDGTQLVVQLKARNLRVDIEDARLYEGRAKGFVTLDGSRGAVAANIQIEGVAAQPLLKDGAGIDSLAGKGRLSLAVAGIGRSEREIVETLNGRADMTVTDGAIVGWNIPQMIRGLGQGKFSGFDRVATEKTDFSELVATFLIDKGIASNRDLRMTSPLVRLTGAGNVELPGRRLDYTVRPKLVASLAGQGGATDAGGFEIPVKIQGPWDRPSYAPDIQAVLSNPAQAADTVRQLGDQLEKKVPGARQFLDQFLKR